MNAGVRLLNGACYVGLSPLIGASRRSRPLVAHHHKQAMALFFLFLVWFGTVLFLDVLGWIGLMHVPDFGERYVRRHGVYADYGVWMSLGALMIFWLRLVGSALRGSVRPAPLVGRLAARRSIVRVAFAGNCLGLAAIPVCAVLALHATSLTRTNGETPAAVYFLYDEGIPVPRWGYALGMYRVSLQAQRNWGKGNIVLDRLNKETLRAGMMHGRVVILATHGGDGYAATWYAPEKLGVFPPGTDAKEGARFVRTSVLGPDNKWSDMEIVAAHDDLGLVYIFGCDVGKKASQWQKHLAPARVITYDRWSSVFDHAVWFGVTGPGLLKRLP
jgi:hypothetical protein